MAKKVLKRVRAKKAVHKKVVRRAIEIENGKRVRYTWQVDNAYGGGTRTFVGTFTSTNDFGRITDDKNGVMSVYLPGADIKVLD